MTELTPVPVEVDPTVDVGTQVGQLAEDLRALAVNGIAYHVNTYDLDRYQRIRAIAAQLLSLVDPRSPAEIEVAFRGDLGIRTPGLAADAAIFDEQGRLLLVQRVGSGEWCMPGGAAEVGETAAQAAAREAHEECGLVVRPTRLLGLFDNRVGRLSPDAPHLYHALFECAALGGEPGLSNETTDVGWMTEADAGRLSLFHNHARKVPAAFRLHREPGAAALFD